jgi:hypothetical protein
MFCIKDLQITVVTWICTATAEHGMGSVLTGHYPFAVGVMLFHA